MLDTKSKNKMQKDNTVAVAQRGPGIHTIKHIEQRACNLRANIIFFALQSSCTVQLYSCTATPYSPRHLRRDDGLALLQ